MLFLHTGDLHIGKRLYEYSLLEEQRNMLKQLLAYAQQFSVDAVIIAGDVYDKSVPSAAAVKLFDEFLAESVDKGIRIIIISGNHDAPERLEYASRVMWNNGVYLYGNYNGMIRIVTLTDDYGEVDFCLMPFIRPASVRACFPEIQEEIVTYEDAVRVALKQIDNNPSRRKVLVAHQFITAVGEEILRADSETLSLGGMDNIDYSLFTAFDYVALGHLHRRQSVGRPEVRYAGSPYKYSFSEAKGAKSVTLVKLSGKGEVEIKELPLKPIHDLRQIEGTIDKLTSPEVLAAADPDDYIQAILTDEEEVIDAINRLRYFYPNLMNLEFKRYNDSVVPGVNLPDIKAPLDLFCDFYELQHGYQAAEPQKDLVAKIMQSWEEKDETN